MRFASLRSRYTCRWMDGWTDGWITPYLQRLETKSKQRKKEAGRFKPKSVLNGPRCAVTRRSAILRPFSHLLLFSLSTFLRLPPSAFRLSHFILVSSVGDFVEGLENGAAATRGHLP